MSDIFRERWKTEPMPHQLEGAAVLSTRVDPEAGRIIPGCLILGDTMRMGKSKQVIDAVNILYERGEIDRALVVTTAAGKWVWWDPEFGEIRKHSWVDINVEATLCHSKDRTWTTTTPGGRKEPLQWFVTNYEYLRSNEAHSRIPVRLEFTLIVSKRTVLILDESSAIKSHKSQQSLACRHLRQMCDWVWLLNGTPLDDNPEDIFAQCLTMSPAIIGVSYITHFRARYAEVLQNKTSTGRKYFTVERWKNLDDLQRRVAPYILRRPEELAGLPPVLDPITLKVALTPATWSVYKEVRDEFVHWADSQVRVTAAQAGVRIMRLAQIASGFLAGLEKTVPCPNHRGDDCDDCGGSGYLEVEQPERELGTEKTDTVMKYIADRYEEEPALKVVVWSRYRGPIRQMTAAMAAKFKTFQVTELHGGQRKDQRRDALRLLHPDFTDAKRPTAMFGTVQTGAMSINLSAASLAIYSSNDYFLRNRLQSEARIRMTGQKRPVQHVDLIAEGPKGQKTVDHKIVKALREKRELVDSIVNEWVTEIREEE